MRAVSDALSASLNAPLTSLAYLWLVRRADGIALGFTTHDRPILFEGMTYRPGPGIRPSAIVQSEGSEAESAEISGVLSHSAISRRDLDAGRYDGAVVELHLIDWGAPQAGSVLLMSGELGGVQAEGEKFSAELLTPAAALDRIPAQLTSPECRASFGDRRCQVDLSRRRLLTAIGDVPGKDEVRVTGGLADGAYSYGTLMPLSGALAGQRIGISRTDGSLLRLYHDTGGLAAGDRILLTQGCDRRWATCRDRFANQANFRGEPYVPGQDSALRYPGL